MNIVVLVKQVPDTNSERTLNTADGILDRAASDAVLDEINERRSKVDRAPASVYREISYDPRDTLGRESKARRRFRRV